MLTGGRREGGGRERGREEGEREGGGREEGKRRAESVIEMGRKNEGRVRDRGNLLKR